MSKGFVIDASARWYTCAPLYPRALCTAAALHHNAHIQSHFTSLTPSSPFHFLVLIPPSAFQSVEYGYFSWEYHCQHGNSEVFLCMCCFCRASCELTCFSVGVDVLKLSSVLPIIHVCACVCKRQGKSMQLKTEESLCSSHSNPGKRHLSVTFSWISSLSRTHAHARMHTHTHTHTHTQRTETHTHACMHATDKSVSVVLTSGVLDSAALYFYIQLRTPDALLFNSVRATCYWNFHLYYIIVTLYKSYVSYFRE